MLEIRNVTKIYRSKTGLEVKALDNVSVTFPETGMVFILGKSGSGKSTMLNVIGGLDGCDAGEFVIKGKSSREFVGSDFDSYRNTFIGFIFQEYNILDDFTVGANIALALELQGKKATNEEISAILDQVGLLDFAKRKPNELSGGQKQRVAIARALVKDPQIIMADEPTGALDSNTGKQILDTLKELSKTKLVIIVSHDRDFAEHYGDRIIEMKDGRIDSDVTKHAEETVSLSSGVHRMNDGILRIDAGYELTDEDLRRINEYLKNQAGDVFITGDRRVNDTVRSAAGITSDGCASSFKDTTKEDVPVKGYTKGESKFIRSRLPMKNALRMGSNSLGHKKFRLVLTIFLSLVAFALFGFADTMGSYNKFVAATDSIIDSNIKNASVTLGIKRMWIDSDGDEDFYHDYDMMNAEDLALLKEKTGLDFIPVFSGNGWYGSGGFSVTENMKNTAGISYSSAYTGTVSGLTELSSAQLDELGFEITGALPREKGEIAITELLYRQFNYTGYVDSKTDTTLAAGDIQKDDLLGKTLSIQMNGTTERYTITAVVDTGFDYGRYARFVPSEENEGGSPGDDEGNILDMILMQELNNAITYGFHGLGFVSEGGIAYAAELFPSYSNIQYGIHMQGGHFRFSLGAGFSSHDFYRLAEPSILEHFGKVTYFDGRTSLGKDEILLPMEFVNDQMSSVAIKKKLYSAYEETVGTADAGWLLSSYGNIFNALQQKSYESGYAENYVRIYLEKLFGRSFSSVLPDEFFHTVADNYFNLSAEEEERYISSDTLAEIYIREYAYESIYNGTVDVLSDEFTEGVIRRLGYEIEDKWTEMDDLWRKNTAAQYYYDYISNHTRNAQYDQGYDRDAQNVMGGKIALDFRREAEENIFTFAGISLSDLTKTIRAEYVSWDDNGNETVSTFTDYTLAGFYEVPDSNRYFGDYPIVGQTLYDSHIQQMLDQGYGFEYSVPHKAGPYSFAIAPMPTNRADVRALVDLSYDSASDYIFEMQNPVMDSLDNFNDFIEMGAKIFMWIGVGFAVFSALMLMNFISVSISYKKREIGILRAVGARSSDVFKIFFSEAAIIALINYVLSLAATVAATSIFNLFVRREGINVTLLSFGIRQVLLMLVISLGVAAIASFLPVYRIAKKKPVDAIKDR